jgi:hypothetical protein
VCQCQQLTALTVGGKGSKGGSSPPPPAGKYPTKGEIMPEGELNTDGAGSGGETGISQADYDKWYGVGKKMEAAKDQGKSY